MANANVVPPEAERLIFAVDVVRFFLTKRYPHLSFELINTEVVNNVNIYRQHARELFTDNIEKVLKDIDDTQSAAVKGEFLEIKNKNDIKGSFLTDYSTLIKNRHLEEDIQAGNFLQYCALISSMACLFYTNGCKDALDIAVDLIKSSFPDDPEKFNLISERMENAALKYATGDVVSPYLLRRGPDPEFSGTEDSSSSSAFTSETESASESQIMSSASSDESLTTLILRLNASVSVKDNSTRSKNKVSTVTSSAVVAAGSSESSIQNPTVSSSSSSRIAEALKCNIDVPSKIESYFKGVGAEPTLPNTLLVESPRKSCLGKRPSPRKDSGNEESDYETEVKKPKFVLP